MRLPRVRFSVRFLLVVVALSAIPLLLVRGHPGRGKIVVIVKTFRGPAAQAYAEALTSELRKEHDLPAFSIAGRPESSDGEPAVSSSEEFSVAVGSYETMKAAQAVKDRLNGTTPRCLASLRLPWPPRLAPFITTKDRLP